jgi:hypothetical protein
MITDLRIAEGVAAGKTQLQIAAELGIHKDTVNYKVKALKPKIEAMALRYFEKAIPKSIDANLACIDAMGRLYGEFKEHPSMLVDVMPIIQQGHKIADRVLQSVGIAPSLAPSVVVQNFFTGPTTVVLNPAMAQALGGMHLPDTEAIDVEYQDLSQALDSDDD